VDGFAQGAIAFALSDFPLSIFTKPGFITVSC
jgi:hypothetical protein